MLDILLWVAVGTFVGWNLPQPSWAKFVQARIEKWWAEFKAK